MKIAACLIVRDSAETIEPCLARIRPFVDEIYVYDTGSTDQTLEIIERMNEDTEVEVEGPDGEPTSLPLAPIRVTVGEWRDDFSWAREQSFQMVSDDVTHLLWLDD